LEIPKEKLKAIRKELGKFLTHDRMSPRKVQAILGTVRSFLMALPALRAFSDELLQFSNAQVQYGWDTPLTIPEKLKTQVKELNALFEIWRGRPLPKKVPVRDLHSDASNLGWAAVDTTGNQSIQDFWRDKQGLHINIKELFAAMEAVKSLAKPGEEVHLRVDNTVAFSYLKKLGGRKTHFNAMLRPFLLWCLNHRIIINPILVKSEDQVADELSRWAYDVGDYSLDPSLFKRLVEKFAPFCPQVDMFASPSNCKLKQFVARWPHHQAVGVDALKMDLSCIQTCFANPPWTLIGAWLERLRQFPHIQCLITVPYWVGSVWWPLLLRLCDKQKPILLIPPGGVYLQIAWATKCLLQNGPFFVQCSQGVVTESTSGTFNHQFSDSVSGKSAPV
jgi:hypothetical protein